jgi:hypothetical protein
MKYDEDAAKTRAIESNWERSPRHNSPRAEFSLNHFHPGQHSYKCLLLSGRV